MAPLTREQIAQLQSDMGELLAKYSLTGGYMVVEHRPEGSESAQHCAVVESAVEPHKPTQLILEMSRETYRIIRSISRMEISINGN